MLHLVDLERGEAHCWIESAAQLPVYVACVPFATLLAWWLGARRRPLLHAACVGTDQGGVLVVGDSGAGKSNVALACLVAGLRYVGDDCCAVVAQPEPLAYGIYCTAKLKGRADLARLPELSMLFQERPGPGPTKLVANLRSAWGEALVESMPIRALLLPRIGGKGPAQLEPVRATEALRALAPSSVHQLPGAARLAWPTMLELVQRLPAYRLHLGDQPDTLPLTIRALVQDAGRLV
jgi:hypothetical protein